MNKNNFQNIKIIYNEVCDARKQQQDDVEIIYNKHNWVIVVDIALLLFLFRLDGNNVFFFYGVVLLIFSLIVSLYSLKLKSFRRGPRLDRLLAAKTISYHIFLEALSRKNIEDIKKNKENIKWFAKCLEFSIYSLILSLLSIVCYIILPLITNLILKLCASMMTN